MSDKNYNETINDCLLKVTQAYESSVYHFVKPQCFIFLTPLVFGIDEIKFYLYTLTIYTTLRETLYSMHCAYDARLQTKEGIGRKEMIAPD